MDAARGRHDGGEKGHVLIRCLIQLAVISHLGAVAALLSSISGFVLKLVTSGSVVTSGRLWRLEKGSNPAHCILP